MADVTDGYEIQVVARRAWDNQSGPTNKFPTDTSHIIFLMFNLLFLASPFLWLGEKLGKDH